MNQHNRNYCAACYSEMPVGDAMSGAAYGEYLKSKGVKMIIGVVAAVAAVATGGATLAAFAAGGVGAAGGLGAVISAGAMVAGGVMSGVGLVTGNTKLTKIGGVLALAGGIGALGFGTSTTQGLLNSSSSTTAAPTVTGADAQTAVMGKVADASNATGMNPEAFSFNAVPPVADAAAPTAAAAAEPLAAAQAATPAPSMAPASPWSVPKAGEGFAVNANALGAAPTEATGFLATASKFANDNKALLDIGGKILQSNTGASASAEGGAALQDSKTALNDAQTVALNAKTAAEEQQRKNMNTQILMIAENDPQKDAKIAQAQAAGIPFKVMFAPGSSGPILAGNVDYTKTQNTFVPTR